MDEEDPDEGQETKQTKVKTTVTFMFLTFFSPFHEQLFGNIEKAEINVEDQKWVNIRDQGQVYTITPEVILTLNEFNCVVEIETEIGFKFGPRKDSNLLPLNLMESNRQCFFNERGRVISFYTNKEESDSEYEYDLIFTPFRPNPNSNSQTQQKSNEPRWNGPGHTETYHSDSF